jgi:hypothetical protein
MWNRRGSSMSNVFGMLKTCSVLSSSSTFHCTVSFHLEVPFDSEIPCILTWTFMRCPSKSDHLFKRQYVVPESIAMGKEFVSTLTPSGKTPTDDEALVLIITLRLMKQSGSLSLDLVHWVFQATVECCQIVVWGRQGDCLQ